MGDKAAGPPIRPGPGDRTRMTGPGGAAESGVRLALCDLDGVVWLGDHSLPGAAAGVVRLRQGGYRVVFVTNNSSSTNAEILARLDRSGIGAAPEEVLSSATAAARMLGAELAEGARVLACAGAGVVEALGAEGLEAVDAGPCEAVVVGWHRTFDFEGLDRAAAAVRAGARFIATNLDPTYPAPGRLLPGNGALTAAVATAAGRRPEVAGKPEPPMVALIRARFPDARAGVVVGDRPSTDGRLASALGWPFALVTSEVTFEEVRSGTAPGGGAAVVAGSLAAVAAALVARQRERAGGEPGGVSPGGLPGRG